MEPFLRVKSVERDEKKGTTCLGRVECIDFEEDEINNKFFVNAEGEGLNGWVRSFVRVKILRPLVRN